MSCGVDCWGHLISERGIVHLNKFRLSIGRGDSCDIMVDDPSAVRMVSLQHAILVRVGTAALLIDTSLNGTYVNSRKISRVVLRPNDTIRLGKRRMTDGSLVKHQYLFTNKLHVQRQTPTSQGVDPQELLSALTCPLCKDLLVFPTELLPCNHLFCSECVDSFTLGNTSNTCPQCQQSLSTYKTKVKYNVVTIVEKALRLVLVGNQLMSYMARFSKKKAELMERYRCLSTLKAKQHELCSSSNAADPFLSVSQAWSAFEKHKFKNGIMRYPLGEARELYCWMVQLTEDWVGRVANRTEISIALSNLDLMTSFESFTMEQAQDALIRYIYGKKQVY